MISHASQFTTPTGHDVCRTHADIITLQLIITTSSIHSYSEPLSHRGPNVPWITGTRHQTPSTQHDVVGLTKLTAQLYTPAPELRRQRTLPEGREMGRRSYTWSLSPLSPLLHFWHTDWRLTHWSTSTTANTKRRLKPAKTQHLLSQKYWRHNRWRTHSLDRCHVLKCPRSRLLSSRRSTWKPKKQKTFFEITCWHWCCINWSSRRVTPWTQLIKQDNWWRQDTADNTISHTQSPLRDIFIFNSYVCPTWNLVFPFPPVISPHCFPV